jgi:hypothetical protein
MLRGQEMPIDFPARIGIAQEKLFLETTIICAATNWPRDGGAWINRVCCPKQQMSFSEGSRSSDWMRAAWPRSREFEYLEGQNCHFSMSSWAHQTFYPKSTGGGGTFFGGKAAGA